MTARCASATNPVEPGTASVIPPRKTHVREVERRHDDGRGDGGATNLHRFQPRPEGFQQNAFEVVAEVLAPQIERRTGVASIREKRTNTTANTLRSPL